MFLRRCLFLLLFACFGLSARAATLYTRQGQFFSGDIEFSRTESGSPAVKVLPREGGFGLTFPVSDVLSIAYRPPLVGVLSGGTLQGDWIVRDVGLSSIAGSSVFGQGIFELRGEGTDIGHRDDGFHAIWQRMPMQGQLIARLRGLSDNGGQSLAGLMIRQSLEAQSRYCFVGVSPDGKSQFLSKPNNDVDASVAYGTPVKFPCWLRLVKYGDTVKASISTEGTTPPDKAKWQFLGELKMEGMFNSYIGMVVTSRKDNELATTAFDHVRLQRNGLKGEFFADRQFSDLRATRIDPNIDFTWGMGAPEMGVPSAEFSARWVGTLEPASTDTYSFTLVTSDSAQLWIDDNKLYDTRRRYYQPGTIKLQAEHRYHIRIEYYKGDREGQLKLLWYTPGQPAQVVPSECFIYRQDADEAFEANRSVTPLQRFVPLARGLLLIDGTFLPGAALDMDGTNLTFKYRDRAEMRFPVDQVARLTFQPLANAAANKIAGRSSGLLTQQGDFIDGDCRSMNEKELKLNSVVFGVSSFDVKTQVAAIVARPTAIARAGWVIHTTTGGVLRADSFRPDQGRLLIQGPTLTDFPLGRNEIIDITAAAALSP